MQKSKVILNNLPREQRLSTGSEAPEAAREQIHPVQAATADTDSEIEKTRRIRMGRRAPSRRPQSATGSLPVSMYLTVMYPWGQTWRLTKMTQPNLKATQQGIEKKMYV